MVDSKMLSATNAYRQAANIGGVAGNINPPGTAKSGGSDFLNMVAEGLDSAIGTHRKAEATSQQALLGKATVDELALSITNAELTLRTIVAIRDKVIAAYQDIVKMPI